MVFEFNFVKSQDKEVLIDFEDTAKIKTYILLDTNQGNLWRIGKPNKSIIHTAYSGNYAIMTDLNKPYPTNNKSSFIIKYFSSDEIKEGGTVYIFGQYKFDSDSLIDTGIVEYSIDKGYYWLNIMLYHGWWGWGIQDSNDKQPMFSGNVTDRWHQFSFSLPTIEASTALDSLYIRFTFISDSIDNSKEGWIIDNLNLFYYGPGSIRNIKENIKFIIYPNPAKNSETINVFCKESNIEFLTIYNTIGAKVFEKKQPETNTTLNCNTFNKGIYFVQLSDSHGNNAVKKIIIF
jgi:hypothetical protein